MSNMFVLSSCSKVMWNNLLLPVAGAWQRCFVRTIVFLAVLAMMAAVPTIAAEPSADAKDTLQQTFISPGDAEKPWFYWLWINGNVTEESIRRDLEEMKNKGASGVLMFDNRGYHDYHTPPPPVKIEYLSAEWLRMLRHAFAEARRLGIDVGINLGNSGGALSGPWPVGDDAPKAIVQTSLEVIGPKRFAGATARPSGKRVWDVAVVAARHSDPTTPSLVTEVLDLSDKMDAQGQLTWDVPPGKWTVLRFAYTLMDGHEKDVDVLDAAAVEGHFQRVGKALLSQAGPPEGRALKRFYSVSWEGAIPTWTVNFDKEFQRRRGYDIRPWLPALAKMTVRSTELSQRFLRDYYTTLSELFLDNCYAKLRTLSHGVGLQWHSESGGPWNRAIPNWRFADQLTFLSRNDIPQGEFWCAADQLLNRPAAMVAHTYGMPLAAVEAFTAMEPHWSEYPAMLKPFADMAFCDGANLFLWHTFTASPAEFGKPGIAFFAGTHLNPNVTWWKQSHAFLTYLARCQYLLRQGRFVADICCYVGDTPYLHWVEGEKWTKRPSLTLGKGYAYDLLSTEVLLHRLSVQDGELVLPHGMRYRLLVVDPEGKSMPPEALQKIADLARSGATVVLGHQVPDSAPGLQNHPAADQEVGRLAKELWGQSDAASQIRKLGRGKIVVGMTLDEVLKAQRIVPDFMGPWNYIHRCDDQTDIYFLSGKKGRYECTFRVRGKKPELWDPVGGIIRDAACYREDPDGRTTVLIDLPENGAVFVIFRNPTVGGHFVSILGPQDGLEIMGRDKGGTRVRVWQQGQYVLKTTENHSFTVDVPTLSPTLPLAGPWQVHFARGWGAPESITFEQLIPWDRHPLEGIKFFSGTATYRISFEVTREQAAGPVRLQLGSVQNIAEVRLNDQPLGVVWTAPWSVDLTGVVQSGKNNLEIDVTNTWQNRLIGDAGLPESKRLTKTNVRRSPADQGRHAVLRGYLSTDKLAPSGLIGPVQLEFGQEQVLQ